MPKQKDPKKKEPPDSRPERDPNVREDRGEPDGGNKPTQRDRDMDTPRPGTRENEEDEE